MNKIKVTLLSTIRNKTNGGEHAKQVVRLLKNGELEDAIHITKYVLVETRESFDSYCEHGFAVGRTFKGKTLMQQRFVIKVSSFEAINNALLLIDNICPT